MNKKLYPIKFTPQERENVWGGESLAKKLNKEFTPGAKIGESWEMWSLYGGSSKIANGFLEGNTLDDLMEIYLGDSVGDTIFQQYNGEFPILIKLLDIEKETSLQIHPNDTDAYERENANGKAEFWYVMEAKPESKIYMGFKKEITPTELYERCMAGTLEEVLNCYTPKKGDCFYIEPGCMHAAKGGILLAEITQSSDITYRIYDWGRENNPQTARKMHLQDAIDIIDYNLYTPDKYYFKNISGNQIIVDTKHFIIKHKEVTASERVFPSLANSFTAYVCTTGKALIRMNDNTQYTIERGETVLIPASMEDFTLLPLAENTTLLEVTMPQLTEDEDNYLNY